MTTNFEATVEAIRNELVRLDATGTPEGIGVYADDELPSGWVRLADGYAHVWGEAVEILAALQTAQPDDETDDDGEPSGWHSAWAAIGDFPDGDGDLNRAIDNAAVCHFTDETTPSEAWRVCRIACNGGDRYYFFPADANERDDYPWAYSPAYLTAEEARCGAEYLEQYGTLDGYDGEVLDARNAARELAGE